MHCLVYYYVTNSLYYYNYVTIIQVEDGRFCSILVSGMMNQVQNTILTGAALCWDSYKLDTYVIKLGEVIRQLQDKSEVLIVIEDKIEVLYICIYQSLFTPIYTQYTRLSIYIFDCSITLSFVWIPKFVIYSLYPD